MPTVVIDGFKLFKHLNDSMAIIINSDRLYDTGGSTEHLDQRGAYRDSFVLLNDALLFTT